VNLTRSAAAVLFLIFLVSACSPSGRSGGYLYYRLNADPTTLDPAYIVDVSGGSISAKLFNGLVRLNHELQVIPDIAETWDISDGGTTYVFHLRKDVFFSNGRMVTAGDFRYSFERVLSPGGRSPNTWVLEKIEGARTYLKGKAGHISGIEVVDEHTLKIRLESPFAPFIELLTMTAAYVVPGEEVERLGQDFGAHPVGTGPFVLSDWKHNTELTLEKNPSYFDQKARVKGIHYRIIPEDLTAVAEFELGNLDLISVPSYEYSRFRKAQVWRGYLSSVEGLNTYYLGFNCSRPPFDNPDLRRAVARAIDREKILRTFYEGRGRLASGPVPDSLRKWKAPSLPQYDPSGARDSAGRYPVRDRVVSFYVNADQEVVDMAEIIQSFLKTAGFQVQIRQLEWSAFKAAVNNGEADMFWLSWWADYPDAENFLFPLFHSANHGPSGNRSRYTNREVDRLIEAGQRSADEEARNELYRKAEHIIVAESPWVFMWHKTDYTLKQPGLKNYRMSLIYSVDKGTEVSF